MFFRIAFTFCNHTLILINNKLNYFLQVESVLPIMVNGELSVLILISIHELSLHFLSPVPLSRE